MDMQRGPQMRGENFTLPNLIMGWLGTKAVTSTVAQRADALNAKASIDPSRCSPTAPWGGDASESHGQQGGVREERGFLLVLPFWLVWAAWPGCLGQPRGYAVSAPLVPEPRVVTALGVT